MHEAQRAGMQRMARHSAEAVVDELLVFKERGTFKYAVAAVALVVEQRMPLPREVHAYLVRAPRFETALDQRHIAVTAQHAVVRDGMLALRAVGKDPHLQPVLGVAAYVARDRTLVLLDIAPHQRHVTAVDRMVEKLLCQRDVRPLVLGHDKQTRRILVDTMHQSGAHVALTEHRQMLQVERKSVDQRARIVAEARVHDHAGGLVDHQKIVVLVYDVERNILRDDLQLAPRVGHDDGYAVERLDLVARLGRLAVDQNVAAVGRRLYAVARRILHAARQKLVQPQQRLSLVDHDREVFEHLVALLVGLHVGGDAPANVSGPRTALRPAALRNPVRSPGGSACRHIELLRQHITRQVGSTAPA